MTTRTKKLFSILLLVCMIVSMIPVAAHAATPSKIYLKPNSNWTQSNARFAAYFFGDGEEWVDAVAVDGGYYEVTVPSGYSNIIFCRMNPGSTANNWDNKWNQTSDLTVPTDGTNCYTVAEGTWDKGGGSWSTISVEPEETDPVESEPSTPSTPVPGDKDYYLIGYINGADHGDASDSSNLGDYKFEDGTLTATFTEDSYVCVKDTNGVWYMTDGWLGQVNTATLYTTDITGTNSNKLYVPGNVEVTFTLVENADGSLTLSYTVASTPTEPEETDPSDPSTPTTPASGDYYLFGYINGEAYGEGDDYATLGQYKFVDGKLTCTFPSDSYVGVKSADNSQWFMTDGWYGGVTSCTLYNTSVYNMAVCDKLMVPGGVELTFTLKVNNDNDTVSLSYVKNNRPGYTDESGIQDGLTLHAWNWSFNAIKENMALIASQGYTAVQTSPIQPVKESTSGKDMHGVWWVQYQPIDFIINTATDNPIGTASEFAAMCAEAEKYGVQVIVDVVANHMANHMSNNTLSLMIPDYIRLDTSLWHDYTVNTSDYTNRYDITQHCMAGIPDLNTGSTTLQGYVINFLKECIDAGADGFRFDGAKHIETPDDDASFASDFWPNVIGAAEDYAESLGQKIYVYGELLDMTGSDKLPMLAYTKYMAVTDNAWGNSLRGAVSGGNAAFINVGYNKPAEADQLVVWAESHDTYATDDAGASSYNLSTSVINKTWALVAARADIMGLYFARPSNFYSTTMGSASLNTGWDFAEVKAVNDFHNAFAGEGEAVGNSGSVAYVVRGNSGIVLVNVSGNAASVSISGTGMADGTYTDQISGNTFKVSGGTVTGSIGSTGIAVVYNAEAVHQHSYTATVTDPTCTEGGYTTYTCSCGYSYVADKVAALGHNYVDGTCSVCGAKDSNEGESDIIPPTVTAKSFTLSFEDEILVNFYYAVSDMTEVTEHGMLVFYAQPSEVLYENADLVFNEPVYDSAKDRYCATTDGIAAKEMGDTRYYVAYAKLSDGTYAYSSVYDYSPKKYSMNMLSKSSTSDAQKALCVAMLNYGAAAQSYFNYNTDSLMNAELTAEQKALVVAYDKALFMNAVAADADKAANFSATDGFNKKSVTVSFEGAFCVNYYFTPSAAVSGDMTLYVWTPEAYATTTKLTAENASEAIAMTAGTDGRYFGQVSGIAAKNLDKTYYVAGVYTDAEGNTYCTGVIAYSLSKYCIGKAVDGNAMKELAEGTAMYGYYAQLYFA